MKVLHIEDEEDILDAFGTIIEFLGHEYYSTTDGREGVKLITENEFDVILLDLTMPEFSGIDVLHELLNHSHSGKVIVLTANELERDMLLKLHELEVYSVLQKPVTLEKLSNAIKSLVPAAVKQAQ